MLPDVKEIGSNAFACCNNLTQIILDEGWEKLEITAECYGGIFCNSALTEIVLPSTLKKISYDESKMYLHLFLKTIRFRKGCTANISECFHDPVKVLPTEDTKIWG